MRKLIISLLTLPLFYLASAQDQPTPVSSTKSAAQSSLPKPQQGLSSGTIASQFDYIFNTSNNYQDYKVVRKTSLEKLKNNIIDSLRGMQSKLSTIHTSLDSHDQEVSSLQDSLAKINEELKITKEQKESFSLLGILLSKGAYNTLVWCVIGLLLILLIFYVYRYRQGHTLTSDAKKTLDDLRDEFDQHRKKAMEREQKLNRRLQDELNKRL